MNVTHGQFKVVATAFVNAVALLVVTTTVGPKCSRDFKLHFPGKNKQGRMLSARVEWKVSIAARKILSRQIKTRH
jgi:hypothetical protein